MTSLREAVRNAVEAHEIECSSSSSDGEAYVRCACGVEFRSQWPHADDERAVDHFFAHQSDAVLSELRAYLVSNEERLAEAGAREMWELKRERFKPGFLVTLDEATSDAATKTRNDARAALRSFIASLFPENWEEK